MSICSFVCFPPGFNAVCYEITRFRRSPEKNCQQSARNIQNTVRHRSEKENEFWKIDLEFDQPEEFNSETIEENSFEETEYF